MTRNPSDVLTYEDMRNEIHAAWVRLTRNMAAWLDANSYLIDRRRYNRARRKAVRAILDGLSHGR